MNQRCDNHLELTGSHVYPLHPPTSQTITQPVLEYPPININQNEDTILCVFSVVEGFDASLLFSETSS